MAALLEAYVEGDKSRQVVRHPGWPKHRVSMFDAARIQANRARILVAIASVGQHLEKYFPLSSVLDVLSKPTRKVIVKQDVGKGDVILAPETLSVKSCPRGDRIDDNADCEALLSPEDPLNSYFLAPTCTDKCMAPLWVVASTPDESSANMEWAKCTVTMLSGVDFVGFTPIGEPIRKRRRKVTKRPSDEDEEEAHQVWVSIPVLVNKVPLNTGDELRFHKPLAAKKPRAPEAITMGKLMLSARKQVNKAS